MGSREYYKLTPVYDEKTVIFVPKDSEALVGEMRHILSREEIDLIIGDSESRDYEWIDDAKSRAVAFSEIISGGDRGRILWIIKELSLYKQRVEAEKKKLYASDAKLLSSAEKVITEEFSFVLGIKREEVLPYILNKLGK